MKTTRKIIEIDEALCDGCGQCVPSCAEGAIEIVDGKARLVGEKYCDGLGACLGECPTGALTVVERVAEAFDERAVEERLASKNGQEPGQAMSLPCVCPSARIQSFVPAAGRQDDAVPQDTAPVSALTHWPVQIRLVPPTAPFLKGADLLVAADCVPVAYGRFHDDFLRGKVVMVGCPKFDEAEEYVQRFAHIFRAADIKSVTVVAMEVPCCQGLPMIVERGMKMADKTVPIEKVVIGARGDILKRERQAA